MKKLTKEHAHDLCVEMWNEIAENRLTCKEESRLVKKHNPEQECFACEYYSDRNGDLTFEGCSKCPFSIYKNDYENMVFCEGPKSIFKKWLYLKKRSTKRGQKYAIAIADLFIE